MIHFVPSINTPAGACLTQNNWQALNINTMVCAFDQLLMKPGLAYLDSLEDMGAYFGGFKHCILDASMLVLNAQDQFTVQSIYDGSRIHLALSSFWTLVQRLRPDAILLPAVFVKKDMPSLDAILPLFPAGRMAEITYPDVFGIYGADLNNFDIASETVKMIYIKNDALDDLKPALNAAIPLYIASDKPAQDAYNGTVYLESKSTSITEKIFELQFEVLDSNCVCPVCTQGFTRAYLHHLFGSTPLLCQRFLIMHNIHCFNTRLQMLSKT